uniref:Aminotransferase class I/classII large domain-containing protein n=2 Tax=Odontella aurita TaxID=265563 RepID=A0A7S4I6X9_9STRA|mmetsp:Transcript_2082/g.5498  ORF Transcript_2082/g.5498 Transcript_2082/m.5498 type:complete len:501 (+) Transcript_2082:137-1639(+)
MSQSPPHSSDLVAAAVLFLVSAAWCVRDRRRTAALEKRGQDDIAAAIPPGASGRVSGRGASVLSPAMSYLGCFLRCLEDPCHPTDNPRGYIALCMAENKLSTDTLARRLMQPGTVEAAFSDSSVYCYNGFLGLPNCRQAVAYFLARRFLRPEVQSLSMGEGLALISPEHVALGSGCASLLNYLCFALAEEGDAILIPAPYYAAFENDIRMVARCRAFPVQMKNPISGPTIEDLDIAARKAQKQGFNVKILLLTNPNNPLGVIYEPHIITNSIYWARSRRVHTIVDEIYALSVNKQPHKFQSVLKILDINTEFGSDVHMLWALSKDFGASGFRIGVLYSQNIMLLQALSNLNIFSGVSHPMQQMISDVLKDDSFIDQYLAEARSKLLTSLKICTDKLEEMVIPFVPPEAGIFVYCDFSTLLPSQDFIGENRFMALVQEAARVVMTPGQAQRDRKPGMMRICYAWVTPEVLQIAMERLSRLTANIRKIGWDELEHTSSGVFE